MWASEVNSQYIGGNITMVSAWHLVSAFYPTVAFWNEGMISATQPWSGHYVASPTIWASAHTTQFTVAGRSWYLPQGKGAGELKGGGTYVSFWDPSSLDLSIVVETAGPAVEAFCSGNCNGVCNYGPAAGPQVATFAVSNLNVSAAAKLAVWRTRLGSENVTEGGLFEQLPDVALVDGKITIAIDPDAIYTLSTVRTATKAGKGAVGAHATLPSSIPASSPFPLPYSDDFESSTPPSPGRYWSDMEGGFEVAASKAPRRDPSPSPSPSSPPNQVLKQTVAQGACCNFIPNLDGPLPLSIIGSSSWEDVEAAISVYIPAGAGWALFGVRSKYVAGSFFRGGLGEPTGIFVGIDGHGYQVLGAVTAAAAGLKWPCGAGCLASGMFATNTTWRRVTLSVVNRTLRYAVGGGAALQLDLPATVGMGSGFAAIATSPGTLGAEIEFDNFTIKAASASTPASRCQQQPKVGDRVVTVGCGDPAADPGARWQIHRANTNGTRLVSLRSDPSLCLSYGQVEAAAEADPPTSVARPAGGLRWNSSSAGHGAAVAVSRDGAWAEWRTRPATPGCDAVALVAAASPLTTTYWVQLKALPATRDRALASGKGKGGAPFVDIGWCAPDIDVSGATWMGWQRGKAWVYRGSSGNFMAADGSQSQGTKYGPTFGPGSNVTAVRHSSTSLEFFLDGHSIGPITLPAGESVPKDAVPCAGSCAAVALGLAAGTAPPGPPAPTPPPPAPPAPPPGGPVRLAKCDAAAATQQWSYNAPFVGISHWGGGGLVMGGGAAGDFAPASVSGAGTQLWWSSDDSMGHIHSRSNAPMTCNCLGVCGA